MYMHSLMEEILLPAFGKISWHSLKKKMAEIGVGKVASLAGRYYAMDRDNNWE